MLNLLVIGLNMQKIKDSGGKKRKGIEDEEREEIEKYLGKNRNGRTAKKSRR